MPSDIETQIAALQNRAQTQLASVADLSALDELRRSLTGKKGEVTALSRALGAMTPDERPHAGQLINSARETLDAALLNRENELKQQAQNAALARETLDVTLPAPPRAFGRRHPLSQTRDDIARIFTGLGYGLVEGPEVETNYYNFDALNIGPDHPARDERDSLFVSDALVLRTETSAVQIRAMESQSPPIKIIAPGRVYRREAVDRTHLPMFQQVEGLCVDENVSFGDLKGTLTAFLNQLFEGVADQSLQTRFRPHYFPFTEPSAEFDVWFNGQWLELGGCGMVHPRVLENVGYDSERYTGFAFGFGIERMAMIKFGIDDLRLFYENDLRFLNQF